MFDAKFFAVAAMWLAPVLVLVYIGLRIRNEERDLATQLVSLNAELGTKFPTETSKPHPDVLGHTASTGQMYFDASAQKVACYIDKTLVVRNFSDIREWQALWTETSTGGSKHPRLEVHLRDYATPRVVIPMRTKADALDWSSKLGLLTGG